MEKHCPRTDIKLSKAALVMLANHPFVMEAPAKHGYVKHTCIQTLWGLTVYRALLFNMPLSHCLLPASAWTAVSLAKVFISGLPWSPSSKG